MTMMGKTRSNQEWMQELTASGSMQDAAIADLRELLLRAALYFFSRNLGDFQGLDREEILQRAEDCAQDALLAVLDHLSDFRGDSKFTTWAYKFAINIAMMAARRERWKNVSLDELAAADDVTIIERLMLDISNDITPEQSALQGEAQRTIQEVIANELTEKQRQVLVLMLIHEVPLDEVVRHLGTNRNAVYKLLHDARRKLKSGLETSGFGVREMITLFGTSR
jgi:RNA polymerase sigma-70 factor (ECF subfamily)